MPRPEPPDVPPATSDWLNRRRAEQCAKAATRQQRAETARASELAAAQTKYARQIADAEKARAAAAQPRWRKLLVRLHAGIPKPILLVGPALLWLVNLLVAIAEKGGKITVLILAALFLLPSLYGSAVRWLPHSYHLVGSLGQPPTYDALPAWNIDLPAVDTGAAFQ